MSEENWAAMLSVMDGSDNRAAMDWSECRTALRAVLHMLDHSGNGATRVAIHVADALSDLDHQLACDRLAA